MYSFGSVTQLNNYAKGVLESDERLSSLKVIGEISGFKVYSSGHAYFTLKDSKAEISCVMYSSYLSKVSFRPKDGDKVELTGKCTIYEVRGSYQIICNTMKPAGAGDLKAQLTALFNKLKAEGLFAPEHKKALPMRPSRIGIISSPTGAVIHDMLVKLNERNPYFDAVLYPASVQGENCPREIIEGLDYFIANHNVDVIIIARGGGSIEDLWGFNSEELARRVYECDIPIISAVGHETDYTILDYVADKRSPTPTAAAEDVLKTYDELSGNISILRSDLTKNMQLYLNRKRTYLDGLRNNRALFAPEMVATIKRNELNALNESLSRNVKNIIDKNKRDLSGYIDKLDLLGPHNVLKRGYSYVTLDDGTPAVSVKSVAKDSRINIVFKDGNANAVISEVFGEDK